MHGIKGLRFALLLAAIFMYQSHHGGLLSARHAELVATNRAVSSVLEAWCDDEAVCNDSVECSTECVNRDVNPQEYITCGDFYNGWADGYCENQCGNCSCDDYEDGSSCPSDCPTPAAGDDACQDYCGETYYNSDGDCGYCGDGICEAEEYCGSLNYCESDCGSCYGGGEECSGHGNCGTGDNKCNPRGYCVAPDDSCTPYYLEAARCETDTDCCDSVDICFRIKPDLGWCIPK